MAVQRVLIVGATSAIAHAVARRLAARGARLALIGRDPIRLHHNADDLRVRGAAAVTVHALDLLDTPRHAEVLEAAWAALAGGAGVAGQADAAGAAGAAGAGRSAANVDAVLVAHGSLPDQARCETSVDEALTAFDLNARSVLAIATRVAPRLESQRHGVLALIGSPAGERGRRSNYVYGAAKAAVLALASGLRHRLHAHGVRVLTVQPGFVDTPMTAAFTKGPLWATPERVAADIVDALDRGWGTVYTPGFWRWIMRIVRALPERVFVRTRL